MAKTIDGQPLLFPEGKGSSALATVPENNSARDGGSSEFSWADDKHLVVINEQPATAVYTNPQDQVVIRQDAELRYRDDQFIFIEPRFLPDILKALFEHVERRDLAPLVAYFNAKVGK